MKILVCNKSYPEAERYLLSQLPGHELLSCDPTDVANHLDGVDIVLPSIAQIDAEIIARGSFGFIQQFGVGLDSVDIDAATQAGVWVANVPGAGSGNTESVAELAILQMLVLARKLDQARKNVENGIFFKPAGMALLNKCVCILGLGDIGTALAMRLRAFGMRIIAVREHPEHGAPAEAGVEKVFGLNELPAALSQADFVVLAIPETKSTFQIINSTTLSTMKKGSFLVNVARGGVVDTQALLEALASGHLGGAGLDVYTEEPFDPKHAIFQQNVVATPHIGGNTDESLTGVIKAIVTNVKLYAEGKAPNHAKNNPANVRRTLQNSNR